MPGAAVRVAMVEGPGHLIEVLEYSSPNDRQTYKPRSCDVGSVHLACYVENIDALLARVTSVAASVMAAMLARMPAAAFPRANF